MKNLLATLAFCILLFNCLTSCNNSEAYTLKMRLQPGDKFKQDIDMKWTIETMGSNFNMGMQETADFEVMAGDTSNKLLKITYRHLLVQMDKNMPGWDTNDSLSKQFNDRLKGKSAIVRLGTGNKIIEVTGLNEILSDSVARPGNEDVRALFAKEELNKTFGMMLGMYPQKPVKAGESWNTATTTGIGGMNISVKRTYTLQSIKGGVATITFEGKLGNEEILKQNGLPTSTMHGTHSGTIQINMEDGYMTKANLKMDIEGNEEMNGQKTPIVLKVDAVIKGK